MEEVIGSKRYSNYFSLKPTLQIDQKKENIIEALKECRMSVDLKWSLFRAASESYKFDSLLKPFPKMYINTVGEKLIGEIRVLANKLETIPSTEDQIHKLSDDVTNLVHWVLFEGIVPKLHFVPNTEKTYSEILKYVPGKMQTWPLPTHIFRVDHSAAVFTTKFQGLAETYGTRFGFHGSRLENFVSVLNYGLQVSMMKVGAFGPGIYLSSELGVSLQYSPQGLSWGGSALGGLLSIVALCEMITNPAVRCRDDNGKSLSPVSFGGEKGPVPNKYFIVENSDLVRLRYLLVYAKNNRGISGLSSSALLPNGRTAILVTIYLLIILFFFGLKFSQGTKNFS